MTRASDYAATFTKEERAARVDLWGGPNAAQNRPPRAYRPCACGCDERDGGGLIGYLSGSDAKGNGITIYAPDEATYRTFRGIFGGDE